MSITTETPCTACGATERYAFNLACAPCSRRRARAYGKARPEVNRAAGKKYAAKLTRHEKQRRRLRRVYGLSVEQREEMERKQGGRCAVCGRLGTDFKKGLVVDHCHETGNVRGLLCTLCNTGIGCFRDDPKGLALAARYLERSRR